MQGENAKSFMGTGFRFPVQVDETTGRMKMSSFEEDIKEAIHIILTTKKGERVRNPHFGCGIYEYAFGTTDFTSLKSMEREIFNALVMWEPRIQNIQVKAGIDLKEEGKLNISIDYVVRMTNNPYNLVFPFYMNEGFGENAK
ncbi:GPW/gp25 family protein [Anaeromicropila populeti]|uniref:IraD/Gp25-like domain-containing protein n=1 Tax=Anaeromicropila populeti TaxID=37658 RepID=A0A1I6LTQ2_9FIRM|nr:GPW/gp25 family protein [Anaeromicropila populeti]SFS06814.1 hypothetical protein SAMN05661086_03554 [Anaeromicropila populeti]